MRDGGREGGRESVDVEESKLERDIEERKRRGCKWRKMGGGAE